MRIILFLIILLMFVNAAFSGRPPGAAPPKEPKAFVKPVPEPDEPIPKGGIQMDNLNLKEPEGPVIPDPKDVDIFKKYENIPEPPIFEPELRFYDKNAKEPEPLIISPDGEIHFICPKGLICK